MILWIRGLLEKLLSCWQFLMESEGLYSCLLDPPTTTTTGPHYKSLVNVVIITYTPLVLEDVEFAVSNLAVCMDASSFSTNVSRITH